MTKEIKKIQDFIKENRLVRKEIIEALLTKLEEINLALASNQLQGGG